MLEALKRDSLPPASPIPLPLAIGGYVGAWFGGQVLAALVITASDADGDEPIPVLFAAVALAWGVFVGMAWWLSRTAGTDDPVADYAVRFRWVDLIGVPVGVITQLGLVPLLYWPLRSLWPDTFSLDEVSEYAEDLVDRASGAEVVLLVAMVALFAPLVEELVYRGLVQRSVARHAPPVVAVLAGAAFFALVHFRPVEYPGLFLVGIVLGACLALTGRLGMAITTHVAFNATGLLVVAG